MLLICTLISFTKSIYVSSCPIILLWNFWGSNTFFCFLFFVLKWWCISAGLFFTYLGLYLMNGHGQPALLYLVPCTLGMNYLLFTWYILFMLLQILITSNALRLLFAFTIFSYNSGLCVILGLVRGELKELWSYDINSSSADSTQPPLPSGEAWCSVNIVIIQGKGELDLWSMAIHEVCLCSNWTCWWMTLG